MDFARHRWAIGARSTVGAQLSSVTARFALTAGATALGIVTAGILAGIIGGRIAGGWLTEVSGWRGALLVFALAAAITALVALRTLLRRGRFATGGYSRRRGLPGSYVHFPALRIAADAARSGSSPSAQCGPVSQRRFWRSRCSRIPLNGLVFVRPRWPVGVVATRIAGVWTDRGA